MDVQQAAMVVVVVAAAVVRPSFCTFARPWLLQDANIDLLSFHRAVASFRNIKATGAASVARPQASSQVPVPVPQPRRWKKEGWNLLLYFVPVP